MANISVVGRIVSDDIELKISANNRPYLRFDLAERTGKGGLRKNAVLSGRCLWDYCLTVRQKRLVPRRADQCGRHTGAGGLSETGWLDAG